MLSKGRKPALVAATRKQATSAVQMQARLALLGVIVASASSSAQDVSSSAVQTERTRQAVVLSNKAGNDNENEFTRQRPARRLSQEGEQAVREWRSRVFDDESADGPPTINVDYADHPFAHATPDSDGTRQTKEEAKNRYKPLRIHFETSPLESLKGRFGEIVDKRIAFIIREVLPVAGKIWTDALSVVPINANLQCHGGPVVVPSAKVLSAKTLILQ